MEKLVEVNIPEVESAVKLRYLGKVRFSRADKEGERRYFNVNASLADQDFFRTFSFEFASGDSNTALAEKNSVVITESLAEVIFHNENPINQVLVDPMGIRLVVTGVIKDVPNFHISFNTLISFETIEDISTQGKQYYENWNLVLHPIYLLVHPNSDISNIELKITRLLKENEPIELQERFPDHIAFLRPLKEIYFNGSDTIEGNYSKHGDVKKILTNGSAAIFALLLACVNFINLNSAKSLERTREIGVKKVSGASRSAIFLQFFGEVALTCFLALSLAVVFAHSLMPHFNELMGTDISLSQFFDPTIILILGMSIILISFISGGVPAIYVSAV